MLVLRSTLTFISTSRCAAVCLRRWLTSRAFSRLDGLFATNHSPRFLTRRTCGSRLDTTIICCHCSKMTESACALVLRHCTQKDSYLPISSTQDRLGQAESPGAEFNPLLSVPVDGQHLRSKEQTRMDLRASPLLRSQVVQRIGHTDTFKLQKLKRVLCKCPEPHGSCM